MKYSFRNDYSEIAHPLILEELVKNSKTQSFGYGLDDFSAKAKENIKKAFNLKNTDIHFVSGGTVANMTVISYVLRPYEAVICADTGHINVHETGAVEASGHKIITTPNVDGKVTVSGIDKVYRLHTDEHMVLPKMVYISMSTETGSIYKKKEIEDIKRYCEEKNMYLFIDGARLASGLTAKNNDVKPSDLADLCDVFYIGGTKIGMMYGEAIVINNDTIKECFRYHIKNRGAMLAKGFVVGIQFERAFRDSLYFDMGRHENELAMMLANGLIDAGYILDSPQETNQLFVRVSKEQMEYIKKEYAFEVWSDGVIRLVTSWFTTKEVIVEFIDYLKKM